MPIDRAQSKKTTSAWSPWIFSPISNNSGSFQETIAVSRILVTGGFLRKKGIHVLVDKGLQKGLVSVTQQQFHFFCFKLWKTFKTTQTIWGPMDFHKMLDLMQNTYTRRKSAKPHFKTLCSHKTNRKTMNDRNTRHIFSELSAALTHNNFQFGNF